MKQKFIIFFLLTFIISTLSFSKEYNFEKKISKFEYEKKSYNNHYYLDLKDIEHGWNLEEGTPMLPLLNKTFLLDTNEKIKDVEIIINNYQELDGNWANYLPAQKAYPISYDGEIDFTPMNAKGVYPSNSLVSFSTEYYRSIPIGIIHYIPFKYDIEQGKLFFAENIEIKVTTENSIRKRSIYLDQKDIDFIKSLTGEKVMNYRNSKPANHYNMLIITNNNLRDKTTEYAEFKHNIGISTKIETVEMIAATQSGFDLQDKIRNYIINEYELYGIKNVLLVGDDDIIPHRGLYADVNGPDPDIAGDVYYAAFDTNWNVDNDDYFGEDSREWDMIPDVGIGRFPVDTNAELQNMINKHIAYQTLPVNEDIQKGLLVGEILNNDPYTPGANYMEQLEGYSSANGYQTQGYDESFTVDKLYDHYGDWSIYDLKNKILTGTHLLMHLGHSFTDYNMKMNNYDISNNFFSTSDGENHLNFIVNTQGCYPGSFDNRGTSEGSYFPDDSFAEKMVYLEKGAVAYIANSRYGWYHPGGTNSSSQRFQRYFMDEIYAQGNYSIGDILSASKARSMQTGGYTGSMLWCYYEINLFGDPSFMFWTEEAAEFSLEDIEQTLGSNFITINLPNNFDNVNSCIVNNANEAVLDGEYDANTSSITFSNLESLEPGIYTIAANTHNYLPTTCSLTLNPPDGAFVVIDSIVVTESNQEIANGYFEDNEELNLNVYFTNIGNAISSELALDFNNDGANYQLLSESLTIPQIAADGRAELTNLKIQINHNPNGLVNYQLPILLSIDQSSKYEYTHKIKINNPKIIFTSKEVSSINGENITFPMLHSDEIAMEIGLKNIGTAPASYYQVIIDENADIFNNPINTNLEELGINLENLNDFTATINSSVQYEPKWIDIKVISPFGQIYSDSLKIYLGNFCDDFEGNLHNWSSESVSYYVNPWTKTNADNHSADGNTSYGQLSDNQTCYTTFAHGRLYMPTINIDNDFKYLKFYQKFDFDETTEDATLNDGGFIQFSIDNGATWQTYQHESYNGVVKDALNLGYAENTPCWINNSGDAWQQICLDFSEFVGEAVKVRFIFFADYTNGFSTGWFIDDVKLDTDPNSIGHDIDKFMVMGNYPNPFNPNTSIRFNLPESSQVAVTIFNVLGQKVKNLYNGEMNGGNNTLSWNGKDNSGKTVGTGVYFYTIKTAQNHFTGKMLLVK